uniref:Uncharacterized protein n=1 Tax=Anguilla anguilla TaxID=7936 RepID=A0A0E9PSN6_ANGAN
MRLGRCSKIIPRVYHKGLF